MSDVKKGFEGGRRVGEEVLGEESEAVKGCDIVDEKDIDRTVKHVERDAQQISKRNGLQKLILSHPVLSNIISSLGIAMSLKTFTDKFEVKSYIENSLQGLWGQVPEDVKGPFIEKFFEVSQSPYFEKALTIGQWVIPLVVIGFIRGMTISPEKFIGKARRNKIKGEIKTSISNTRHQISDYKERLDPDVKILFESVLDLVEFSVLGDKQKFLNFQENLKNNPGLNSSIGLLLSRLRRLEQVHTKKGGKEVSVNAMNDDLCIESLEDASFSELYLLSEALKREVYAMLLLKKSDDNVDDSNVNAQIEFITKAFNGINQQSLEVLEKGSSTLRNAQMGLAVFSIIGNLPVHGLVSDTLVNVDNVLGDGVLFLSQKLDENGVALAVGLLISAVGASVARRLSMAFRRATDPIELEKLQLGNNWERNHEA